MISLNPTYGNFTVKGEVIGLHNEDSLTSGQSKEFEWKRLEFGVKINERSIIYVNLFGLKTKELKIFSRKKRLDKSNNDVVEWDKRFEINLNEYRFGNEVELNFDPQFSKENVYMLSWDAIEYILENVSELKKVLINGQMNIETYKERTQVKFNVKSIFSMNEDEACGAWFDQDVIIKSFDSKTQSVNAFIFNKKKAEIEITEIAFKAYEKKVLQFFEKCDIIGKKMRVHGTVLDEIEVEYIEGIECISDYKKELIIIGGKLDKQNEVCYNIEDIERIKLEKIEQKSKMFNEETGFNIEDDVNEHGF